MGKNEREQEMETQTRIKIAEIDTKLSILIDDFQKGKAEVNKLLSELFALMREFPDKVTECRDELEGEIKDRYMTKKDAKILKVWFIASASGVTTTAAVMMYFFKIGIIVIT